MHTRQEYDGLIPPEELETLREMLATIYKGQDLEDAMEDTLEEQYQEYLDNLY